MRPLLVETNGNYTILHNDIRVYLSRIIGRDNDWIEEVYSFLASYYINLSEEEKGYSYYNDVLRFLIYAKRASEFKNIFTPDFIISSFVYGIGINEIYSRANDFLKRTIDENVIDWEQMKCLAFGYLTIDQIEKSQNEIEGANFRTTNQYIPVNSYECYVKPFRRHIFRGCGRAGDQSGHHASSNRVADRVHPAAWPWTSKSREQRICRCTGFHRKLPE